MAGTAPWRLPRSCRRTASRSKRTERAAPEWRIRRTAGRRSTTDRAGRAWWRARGLKKQAKQQ